MSLSLQEHIRRSREAVAANRAKGNRHAELLTRLYSDPYRFLDEILQNTEDAYARRFANGGRGTIRFLFDDSGLGIVHNGIDFDEEDLKAITTFAGTTKTRDDGINQIGKFGIGFRSVYAMTDQPEIHCGQWHFRIEDYEVLEETAPAEPPEGFGTLIYLPFRESEIRKVRKWVREGLDRLNIYSLLFLNHITEIEIYLHGKLHRKLISVIQPLSASLSRKTIHDQARIKKSTGYLLLNDEDGRGIGHCAIALRLSDEAQGKQKIVRDDHPYLFVYFPTRQESHLGFPVHAGFTTTPTREAIPFDPGKTPENHQLLVRAAALLSHSLVALRNLGYVDASFFEVLPVLPLPGKDADPVYRTFQQEITRALQQKKIIPVQQGNHGLAKDIMVASEPVITELLDAKALQLFYQRSLWLHEDFRAVPLIQKTLISLCGIKEADSASVAFRISIQPEFLKEKTVKWYKLFYAFLSHHPELWDDLHRHEHYSLRYQPILRLRSGENVAAYDRDNLPLVFLPQGKRTTSGDIHPEILKDEGCLNFIHMLGVSKKEKGSAEISGNTWVCEAGAKEAAGEIDLQIVKPEKISLSSPMEISLFSALQANGGLVTFPDPFHEMLNWSVECARILLARKFPNAIIKIVSPDQALITVENGTTVRKVFVGCRAPLQHRYLMPSADWAAMYHDQEDNTLLMLISEAGTARVSAWLFQNPGPQIRKGRFIGDPVGFNVPETD